MKRFTLLRVDRLLLTKAAIRGPKGVRVLTLLVDTGSTYTILPEEALSAIGCQLSKSRERIGIITGSGRLQVPVVQIDWLQALGRKLKNVNVAAHTLPTGIPIDGLLGMDFLVRIKAKLDLAAGTAETP